MKHSKSEQVDSTMHLQTYKQKWTGSPSLRLPRQCMPLQTRVSAVSRQACHNQLQGKKDKYIYTPRLREIIAKFVMMMKMMMSMVLGAVLLKYAAAQTVHVVGDSMGWDVPTNAGAYDTWAASKKFVVGDILTFKFVTGGHDVQQVPKTSYDGCTASNPIGNLITTGPANITLGSAGDHYYICTVGRHCQLGQKLSITVSATPGASPTPTTPTTTTTTPPPTTPSPNSVTPEDCTPAPTSGPTANSPRGSTSPSGPTSIPESSSPGAFASVLLPMMAVVMGLMQMLKMFFL